MIARMLFALLLPAAAMAGRAHLSLTRDGCGDLEQAMYGDTCQIFADAWLISVDQFKGLNPSIDCSKPLAAGQNYCVAAPDYLA
jgi:hypothetical protein